MIYSPNRFGSPIPEEIVEPSRRIEALLQASFDGLGLPHIPSQDSADSSDQGPFLRAAVPTGSIDTGASGAPHDHSWDLGCILPLKRVPAMIVRAGSKPVEERDIFGGMPFCVSALDLRRRHLRRTVLQLPFPLLIKESQSCLPAGVR